MTDHDANAMPSEQAPTRWALYRGEPPRLVGRTNHGESYEEAVDAWVTEWYPAMQGRSRQQFIDGFVEPETT